MTESVRETYIAGLDPAVAPLVVALDRAITAASPDLGVRIYYRMLTYVAGGDVGFWICAIDARTTKICLRFLFGTRLHDPLGRLRAGTSHLATLDVASVDDVDASYVGGLVSEAVARLDELRAEEKAKRTAKKR